MATPRNVWLPGAAVWACLPHTSELLSSPTRDQVSLKSQNALSDDGELLVEIPRKRRKGRSSRVFSDFTSVNENTSENFARMDDEADAPGLGLTIDSKEVSTCPICLCDIEEAGGAVLQWCMHQFCVHCIEKWSRIRRSCPLCKAKYRGWYYDVQSNSKFLERILPPVAELSTRGDMTGSHASSRDSRRQERGRGRLPPRSQGVTPGTAAASSSGQSMPFPTQRSFGLPKEYRGAQAMRVLEEQAAAKILEWRKSIYNRNLIARPFDLRRRSTGTKDARAERRLEPWVRRELQAVLPNSDHDFLVRLVLGLWFGTEHEAILRPERPGGSGGPSTRYVTGSTEVEGTLEKAIKELKRFLGDKTEVFWHELRCFAESPFTMQAYDTIVVYSRHDNSRRPIVKVDRKSSYQDRSRRGAESALSRSTSMPLHNEGPAHLENNRQIVTTGRHRISHSCAAEGAHGSSEQQQQDSCRDSSQALLNRRSKANLRKKRQHMDVIPIAEDRWQLS